MAHPGARDSSKGEGGKSRPYTFRLHPELPDEKYAIEQIERASLKPGGLRRWIVDLLKKRDGLPVESDGLPASTAERIIGKLDKILTQLKSRRTVDSADEVEDAAGSGLDDGFLHSLERYLDVGMSADGDEYEGEG